MGRCSSDGFFGRHASGLRSFESRKNSPGRHKRIPRPTAIWTDPTRVGVVSFGLSAQGPITRPRMAASGDHCSGKQVLLDQTETCEFTAASHEKPILKMNVLKLGIAPVRTRNRYLRRLARRTVKRAHTHVVIRFIRVRPTVYFKTALAGAAKLAATLIACLILIALQIFVQAPADLKAGEVNLTSAVVIGGALALVLSLSIIPAQKAAEAFSPAILKLYARDRALLIVFLILVLTTMGSILLGTGWIGVLNPKSAISIQLVLLGLSFDALRRFYTRTLDLLAPETAVRLVLRECSSQLARVKHLIERLVRVLPGAGSEPDQQAVTRAILYANSQIAEGLRAWIAQLDEFAHKGIARRDTHGANEIISAMGVIGQQYAHARSGSVILLPDWDFPLAGGVSDIGEVLNPIYESIRAICQDAANASNELIVRHCIKTLEKMTTNAMQITRTQAGHWRTAPLAHTAAFYMNMCTEIAIRANMADAVLAAVDSFRTNYLKKTAEVDTRTAESQVFQSLFTIAVSSYARPDSVWAFPAMKAMLYAARHDINVQGYGNLPALETVLGKALQLVPFEVQLDATGQRFVQTYPPYDLGFEANIAVLLDKVASQVTIDAERPWVNPFHEFLEASEDILHHFRDLARINFKNSLLRKWIVDTLMAVAQVHLSLLTHPPAGSESHLDDIDNRVQWVVHSVAPFFPENQPPFHYHHAQDACGALTILGMNLLLVGRTEAAQSCGTAIAGIAAHGATSNPEPYGLADLQEKIEVLARAADALGSTQLAATLRAMVGRPPNISEADWPHFLEARRTRIQQLDQRLGEIERYPRGLPDDPIPLLRKFLAQGRQERD